MNDGRVLLIRRAHEPWLGAWDIPGGFCEPGEHPVHTAERELLEETGYHGRCRALIGLWMDTYGPPEPDGLQSTTLNVAYLTGLDAHVPRVPSDGEATETAWFALDDVPQEIAFPAHALRVLAALPTLLAGQLPPLLDRP